MKHKVHEIKLQNGAKGLIIDVPDASVMNFYFDFRAGEYLVSRINGKCRILWSTFCWAPTN